ncbi:MAG: BRCT domain-containing protein [Methylobacillus sp.]|jgi:NAD-dependent DNA ligase|nr:BRCT domain-containing protein [Methylobacillus sp.]
MTTKNQYDADFPKLSIAAHMAMQQRIDTRAMQTLLGICSGLIADKNINDQEIAYLRTWIAENPQVAECWPGSAITAKIDNILADGVITKEERQVLLSTLQELTGNHFGTTGSAAPEAPALPIDSNPAITFPGMTFCFTGNFMYGTRAACEKAVTNLGGIPADTVSKKLNYLVIGSMIEPSWAHTTYGRKIEKATHYQGRGASLTIISERQWFDAMARLQQSTCDLPP